METKVMVGAVSLNYGEGREMDLCFQG